MKLPKLGEIVHEYHMTEQIYETQFSHIFKAEKAGNHFVLKFLKQICPNQGLVSCEAEILNQVRSKYIIPLVEEFTFFSTSVLVFPLASDGDLLTFMSQNDLSKHLIKSFIKQICSSLEELHSQGIVHKDIKPENILIHKKQALVADFGLSERIEQNKQFTNSRLSTYRKESFGTLEYSSPEIISGNNVDFSTDMWSLGVVSFCLITGTFPFPTCSESVLKLCILRGFVNYKLVFDALAKDFLSKLLVVDPSKRLTASEALKHSWLN
jgi:serine/threonine protein kinase